MALVADPLGPCEVPVAADRHSRRIAWAIDPIVIAAHAFQNERRAPALDSTATAGPILIAEGCLLIAADERGLTTVQQVARDRQS